MIDESPYCPDCSSCGEDGCCSPFLCLRTCVSKSSQCLYGKDILDWVELDYNFSHWVIDTVDKKGVLSAKDINTKYGDMIRELQEKLNT